MELENEEFNNVSGKGIVYRNDDEGTKFPMLLTVFDGEGTILGDESGARGRYVLFTFIDGGIQDQFYDPYEMDLPMGNEQLRDFCLAIKRGWETGGDYGIPWEEIVDDGVYNANSFPELV